MAIHIIDNGTSVSIQQVNALNGTADFFLTLPYNSLQLLVSDNINGVAEYTIKTLAATAVTNGDPVNEIVKFEHTDLLTPSVSANLVVPVLTSLFNGESAYFQAILATLTTNGVVQKSAYGTIGLLSTPGSTSTALPVRYTTQGTFQYRTPFPCSFLLEGSLDGLTYSPLSVSSSGTTSTVVNAAVGGGVVKWDQPLVYIRCRLVSGTFLPGVGLSGTFYALA